MNVNTFQPLVGERCPEAYLAGAAGNRNNYGVSGVATSQLRAGSSRTAQERAGSVDTRLTQQSGFLFADRSPQPPDRVVDLADVFGYGPSAPGWLEPGSSR